MAIPNYMQKGTFGVFLKAVESGIDVQLIEPINRVNNQVINVEQDFLRLATKAFGFNVIENFLQDGKKFFNALPTITTFESFLDLVESIFLSREITVTYLEPAKIALQINNHNMALLSNYVDSVTNEYTDNKRNIKKNYIGFKAQEFLGLADFFKKFLQPFLPAGVLLESVSLKVEGGDNKNGN